MKKPTHVKLHFFSTFLIAGILVFSGCNNNKKQIRPNPFIPKITEAKGHILLNDSLKEPTVVLLNKSKLITTIVKQPSVTQANANTHLAGLPKVNLAGKPIVYIIGKDSFLLPKTIPVVDSSFVAGIPMVVVAKDADSKDQNPQNFNSFNKLQGLKHGSVTSLLQDKNGNIWFGTNGGASKFDGNNFTHYTIKEGLPNNVIWSIFEDSKGNIWFGTFGGACKYDGKKITNYTTKEGLPFDDVRCILEDNKGNIWLGTFGGGLCKYDGKNFTNYNTKQGLTDNDILCILKDKKENIWIGTGAGLCKFDGKSFTNYTKQQGLSSNAIWCLTEDKDANIWIGTYGSGVSKFDGKNFNTYTQNEGLSNNDIRSIKEDKEGNIWFGTYGDGISKYDGKTFTNFTENDGLTNNVIWSILQDNNHNLWFGTNGGGVCKYNGNTFTHFTKKENLLSNIIWNITQDKKHNLWFATNGGGVFKFDGNNFINYAQKDGLLSNDIKSVFADSHGNIWIGTYGSGLTKFVPNEIGDGGVFTHYTVEAGLLGNTIINILEDRKGNLWFGTNTGAYKFNGTSFTCYTEEQGLSNNVIWSSLLDNNGNIWFGTASGVSKFTPSNLLNSEEGTFTNYGEKQGLTNNVIWSIYQDKNDKIWFGTGGNGVYKFDGNNFTQYTENQGLINNVVLGIVEDKKENLWFATRYGVSKLSNKSLTKLSTKTKNKSITENDIFFKNFSYEDGFLGIGCNSNSIFEAQDGSIWIGTNDRLTIYHPKGETIDTTAPNIQIVNIKLFDESINWSNLFQNKDTVLVLGNGVSISNFCFDSLSKWYSLPQNLSLAYNNNYLTFNFIGITLAQPKKVKYKYKLEGIDGNYSALTTRTEAPYGNLPQGTYTFKVKAMNAEGYWSKEVNYIFTVRPPWWKTWWMYLIYITTSATLFWIIIRIRTNSLLTLKKNLKAKIAKATLDINNQKNIIEEKHKEITDSINYAERIQHSFLASHDLLNENLSPAEKLMDASYFVFFQPKDVVSGDFYWASKLSNGNFALVTADSTGHGVPGAIMSILNISSLEKAVEQGLNKPAEILNATRKHIIERLKKDGSKEGGKDGMDASIISFNFALNTFTYAAANNSVLVVRENNLIELESDKMPVGKHDRDEESFREHEFILQKNDVIYTLTDGMSDQFGGPKGKKFMYKKLKQLLLSIAHLPMPEQKQKLNETLINWKGDLEQVDDITVIGIKI